LPIEAVTGTIKPGGPEALQEAGRDVPLETTLMILQVIKELQIGRRSN
jgi:hypothetical protein